MEQPIVVKCFLCGSVAGRAYAYARVSKNGALLGVIYRGVCDDCLANYIESIKQDRQSRAENWFWLPIILPIGGLMTVLAKSPFWRMVGVSLILLAFALPFVSRLVQRREAIRARLATQTQNEEKYSRRMCLEDASRGNYLTRRIPLEERYCAGEYSIERISREVGVSHEVASQIKFLSLQALERMKNDQSGCI